MTTSAARPAPALLRRYRPGRFTRAEGGTAALEFALMAPVLLLVLMGVIELTNAMTAKRKLLNAAQTTADLISQQTSVTDSDLDTYFLAGELTISPLEITDLSLAVASVRYDDTTGDPTLDWTAANNGGLIVDPLINAQGRGDAGDSIVIVYGSYSYNPLVSMIIPGTVNMSEIVYMRPRTVNYIIKN